jgi:carbon-monoxide dehydrogenase medium subunit
MLKLDYQAPETVDAAVALLQKAGSGARVLAGGTDMLVQMREDIVHPSLLIDIKKIAETRMIEIGAECVTVGAAVTGAELGEHAELKAMWPGVVEAVNLIGSDQIQGRATIGGNLCNASPAADSVPALVAAGAKVAIAGPKGRREIAAEAFPKSPGRTALEAGEFVTAIILPRPAAGSADAYLRFIPRTEMDIAVVGAGVALTLDKAGTCTAARLSLGAVAPTVLLVDAAAKALIGTKLEDGALAAFAAAASAACRPIDDKRGTVEFRVHVAGVLARRAALIAAERARASKGERK